LNSKLPISSGLWPLLSIVGGIGAVWAVMSPRGRLRRRTAQVEEEGLGELIQDLEAVIWEKDAATGSFSFISQKVEEMLGYPAGAWRAQADFWAAHIHPEDREATVAAYRKAGRRGGRLALEYRMIAADGRAVWVRDRVRVAGRGRNAKLRGVMVDITHAVEAEQGLARSEAAQRALLGALPDLVWRVRRDGTYLDFGGTAKNLDRHPEPSSLLGRTFREVLPPDIAEGAAYHLEQAFATGEMQVYECPVQRGGAKRVYEARLVPTGQDEAVVVIRDITAYKSAEEALRQANEALQAVIQACPLAIYGLDLTGCVTRWNPAAEAIFGWAEQEVLGKRLPFVPERELEGFYARLERARLGTMLSGFEARRIRKDGSPVDIGFWSAPVRDAGGATVGFMNVAANVTERKMLEEQLRQSQKMEAVGRLAGGVAHDFNNLLTVITGYGHMLLEDVEAQSPLLGSIEEILKAADRAAALTNQLLAFSRRQLAQPKILDLNAIVLDMDNMLRRVIGEDVELSAALAEDIGNVRADPGQVQQIIMNLVVNSRDAMPHGGKITIETANVDLDEETGLRINLPAPAKYVMLGVTDTGYGMDAETRLRIFEPFFTTKEQGKGTGLGLSTVFGIVKQSGGEVEVISEPGQGAQFRVYLPRVSATGEPLEVRRETPQDVRGSETILLVEDEAVVRKLVKEILAEQGYTILEAEGPQQALAVQEAYRGDIQLLLTDLVMPDMNGRELAERLTALRPGIKVLFMSGYTGDTMVRETLNRPGLAFLQKPFTPGALARKVRKAIERGEEAAAAGPVFQ
jgi:PAS domain S-box-containing protein